MGGSERIATMRRRARRAPAEPNLAAVPATAVIVVLLTLALPAVSTGEGIHWTRVAGTFDQELVSGVYGVRGTGTAAPTPGGRFWSAAWRDGEGALWLYGGATWRGTSGYDLWSDLWRLDPRVAVVHGVRSEARWSLVEGATTPNATPVRGALGVATPGTTPGARAMAASWTGPDGRLWLLGGFTGDGAGSGSFWNDLWRFDPATGLWTWVKGAATAGQSGVYGTRGVAAAANTPGARSGAVAWVDAAGSLWLFGGVGQDQQGTFGFFNDLWRYTPSTGKWAWMHGSSAVSQAGVYGTRGVAAAANTPGGRDGAAGWVDGDGTLWLYGGRRQRAGGSPEFLDDLWRYTPSTGFWAWVKGASTPGHPAVYGDRGVAAAGNTPGARWHAAAWADGGSLWLLGGQGPGGTGDYPFWNDLWRFDPAVADWTWVDGGSAAWPSGVYGYPGEPDPATGPGGRYGAAAWTDDAGRLWLFGGDGRDAADGYDALNDLWRYDPAAGAWAWIAGSAAAGQASVLPTADPAALAALHPGGRTDAARWLDGAGNLWLFGGYGSVVDTVPIGLLNDLWRYEVATGTWRWVTGAMAIDAPGRHGTAGVARVSGTPGARDGAAAWTDRAGRLWLFGGEGRDSAGGEGLLSDEWVFDLETGLWTWAGGASERDRPPVYGTRGVAAAANTPGARAWAMTWTDAAGRFWLLGGQGYDTAGGDGFLSDLWRRDPDTGWWTWVSGPAAIDQPAVSGTRGVAAAENTPGARGDAAVWVDHAGFVWLFGGSFATTEKSFIYNDLWRYDPASGRWTWVAGAPRDLEFADYGERGVAAAGNIPGARIAAATWRDTAGSLWMFGGFGFDGVGWKKSHLGDLWRLDPAGGTWTWMAGPEESDLPGACGTPGVDDLPGSRNGAAVWQEAGGRVWLFGGWGNSCTDNQGSGTLDDLWTATAYSSRGAVSRRVTARRP